MGGGGAQQDSTSIASKALGYNASAAGLQQGMNTMNQTNSMGSSTYTQNGTMQITMPDGTKMTVPKYSQSTTLSAPNQRIFDQATAGAAGQLQNFNSQGAFDGGRATADKITEIGKQRLDPQWNTSKQQFDSEMANQGIAPGSAAYNDSYQNFAQAKNDAYNSLYTGAQGQAFNQAMQQYQMPLQAAGQMQQIANGTNPVFGNIPQTGVSGVDFASLANAQNQRDQSSSDAMKGGLFGLGGTLLGML